MKIFLNTLYNTKICSNFALLKIKDFMEKRLTIEATELEADLIAAIRNYTKSYPDGYPQLLDYAQRLFDQLIDPFAE